MTASTTTTTYVQEVPSGHLPIGVAIIAVLLGIFGFVLLIIGILGLLGFAVSFFGGFAYFGATGLVASVIVLIVSLIILSVAFGLWNQELWALVLAIIVVGALWILDVLADKLISLSSLILFVLLVYLIAVHRNFI